ncbi:MAG TPA: AI-2E family transporter [Candidatus Fournierella merdavium]|uniref:AI-2E family transporter n=1 Tax=Candidatus Allofournierella merdavium TaxID=2838593 RepID=UPI001F8CBDBF|nr:AI-2E family transporter [Candidatus Fournierella merdavium]
MNQNNRWRPNPNFFSNLMVVLIGISFYLAMSHLDLVRQTIGGVLGVLSPFVGGFVIAYLLDGPVRFFEEKFSMKRGVSIAVSYLLAVALFSVLLSFVLPQVVQSVMVLGNNLNSYLRSLNSFVADVSTRFHLDEELIEGMMLSYTDLMQRSTDLMRTFMPQLLNYSMAVGSGVVSALTAFIASVYMLMGKYRLLSQMRKVIYAFLPMEKARRTLTVCRNANRVFNGFIYGKLIDSAIIGVLCFILMSLFKMPFALLISVVVGVTNVIPFFGPFIGAIPSVMILLMVDPIVAIEFGVLILILQQFDGNILGPKILGDSTGLSAIWVLVAIIVGGGLFGFVGMVIGVPTFAVLYSLTSDLLARRLKAKGIDKDGNPLPADPADGQGSSLPEGEKTVEQSAAEK